MCRRRPRGLFDHRQSAPFPKVLEENQNHQLPRTDRYRRPSSALLKWKLENRNPKIEIRKATRERPHPCKKQTRKDGPPRDVFRNQGAAARLSAGVIIYSHEIDSRF